MQTPTPRLSTLAVGGTSADARSPRSVQLFPPRDSSELASNLFIQDAKLRAFLIESVSQLIEQHISTNPSNTLSISPITRASLQFPVCPRGSEDPVRKPALPVLLASSGSGTQCKYVTSSRRVPFHQSTTFLDSKVGSTCQTRGSFCHHVDTH